MRDEVIFGFKPVFEALEEDPQGISELWVSAGRRKGVEEVLALAARGNVPVRRLEDAELATRCGGGNHQGLAACVAAFAYAELPALVAGLGEEALVVVLDGVQDPRNLGGILRTAAGFGVSAVCIPERRAAQVTPAAVRASAGLARRVPVCRVGNVTDALEALKAAGFWISGAAVQGGSPPWEIDLRGRVALVLGSEGRGIRPRVLEACDHRLGVPLAPGVESLNVGTATAALCYEVIRQRAGAGAKKPA